MRKRDITIMLFPGLFVLLADQLVKRITEEADRMIIPGIVKLTGTHNPGMALGILAQSGTAAMVFSLAAIVLLVFLVIRLKPKGMALAALSMLAGGAAGNLTDRVFLGYVRDMIEVLFVRFYIFNVADAAITVGACLCAVSLLFRPGDWGSKECSDR